MKYLRQALIIAAITFAAEIVKYLLPLPIPVSIYGLAMLFFLLKSGLLALEQVQDVGNLLLELMPLLLVPASVSFITALDTVQAMLLPVLIMYALLRKFLFKPVQDVIAKRQQMVDASMADAQEAKNKALAALNAAEDKLHNVDVEAAARREASEQLAEKQKEQLLADAQRQADAIVAEGKAAAEAERASKLRQADAQIADLTRTVCAKVLERNLTQQDDARLLDDLLQKAGDSDGKRS